MASTSVFIAKILFSKLTNSFLSLWLNDPVVVDVSQDAIVDRLLTRFSDYKDARQLQVLIEQVSDDFIVEFARFLDNEFKDRKVAKGDMKRVVEQCAEIIVHPEFVKICTAERFNLHRTMKALQASEMLSPMLEGFDTELAKTVSKYFLSRIILSIEDLPAISSASIKQILTDTEVIINKLNTIEVRFEDGERRHREKKAKPEIIYRKVLANRLRKIHLFGFTATSIPRRYDLSIAYVNLSASRAYEEEYLDENEELTSEEQVAELVESEMPIVPIIGEPGSGKTTLMSWLALKSAEQKLPRSLSFFQSLLPVFVRLREFSKESFPTGNDLLLHGLGAGASRVDEAWIVERMGEGSFSVFLDGLDELPAERRSDALQWASELVETYPESKFFLAARPYVLDEIFDEDFFEFDVPDYLEVRQMDRDQISRFISQWFDAYRHEFSDETFLAELDSAKERLLFECSNNDVIRVIASNPLICSLICFITADRSGYVPNSRIEVYNNAVDVLLDTREKESGISLGWASQLKKRQKLAILAYIAEYFYQREAEQLPVDEVAQCLAEFLPSLDIPDNRCEDLIHYLVERSNILRSPAFGLVDFSHKTFLEYFFALRLTQRNLREFLSNIFFDPDYREVVLFACAMGGAEFVEAVFVEAISSVESEDARMEHLMIYQALQEAGEVPKYIRDQCRELISHLLPPKNSAEVRRLRTLDGEGLRLMASYASAEYKDSWVFCTQVLLQSMSGSALEPLRKFAQLGNEAVDKEILSSSRFFERRQFLFEVLKFCTTIKHLDVHDREELEIASEISSLTSIDFHSPDEIQCSGVSKNSAQSLEIFDCNMNSFDVVSLMPDLTSLVCHSHYYLTLPEKLPKSSAISSVRIEAEGLRDATPLGQWRTLEEIDLENCVELEDYRALAKLPSLRRIFLPYAEMYDCFPAHVVEASFRGRDDL